MVDDVAALERRLAAGEELRLAEVAKLTGRGRSTIQGWIKSGRWKPRFRRTLGGQRHFAAEDVRALLVELREVHGGDGPAPAPGSEREPGSGE